MSGLPDFYVRALRAYAVACVLEGALKINCAELLSHPMQCKTSLSQTSQISSDCDAIIINSLSAMLDALQKARLSFANPYAVECSCPTNGSY